MERYCSYETWIQPSWSVSYRRNTSVNLWRWTRKHTSCKQDNDVRLQELFWLPVIQCSTGWSRRTPPGPSSAGQTSRSACCRTGPRDDSLSTTTHMKHVDSTFQRDNKTSAQSLFFFFHWSCKMRKSHRLTEAAERVFTRCKRRHNDSTQWRTRNCWNSQRTKKLLGVLQAGLKPAAVHVDETNALRRNVSRSDESDWAVRPEWQSLFAGAKKKLSHLRTLNCQAQWWQNHAVVLKWTE